MIKCFLLLKQSICLDCKFLKVAKLSTKKKLEFIFKKYYLLILHFFRKFKLGKSYVYLFGKKLYYDSRYGLAGFQRVYSSHQNLIDIGKINRLTTIINVGAYVGGFTKLMRQLYRDSNVFAIEPIPLTFKCLKKNFAEDNKVRVFNVAISSQKRKVKMSFDEQNPALSSISKDGNILVKTETLDYFVKKIELKILIY